MTRPEMPDGSKPGAIDLATAYLESAGMTILADDGGEPCIVASDHGTFVACQVEERAGTRHGTLPEDDIPARARELRRTAEAWLGKEGLPSGRVRVDLVVLTYEGTGGYTIEHLKDAALASR